MKTGRLIATLAAAALVTSAGVASAAAPLVFSVTSRGVSMREGSLSGELGVTYDSNSSGDSQFDVVLDPIAGGCCSHAEQHSSVTSTGISGSGNILTGGFNAYAASDLYVQFEVMRVTAYRLDGFIDGTGHHGEFFEDWSVGPSSPSSLTLDGPFATSGFLVPGKFYSLDLGIFGNVNTFEPASGQWQVALTVPEPALGLLPLVAFGALALTRWRESLRRWQPLPAVTRAGR